jgi:hypothetical protein
VFPESQTYYQKHPNLTKTALVIAGILPAAWHYGVDGLDNDASPVAGSAVEQLVSTGKQKSDLELRIERINKVLSVLGNVDETEISGKDLRQLDTIAAYQPEKTFPKEKQNQLDDSLVVIMKRAKNSSEMWQPWCSGNKVSIAGKSYVQTATHCFSGDYLPAKGGGFSPEGIYIRNISGPSRYEYRIADPIKVGVREPEKAIMATVTGVSSEITTTDLTLLRVEPVQSSNYESFDDIPSLPFRTRQPKIGEKIYATSATQTSGYFPNHTYGTYVGKIYRSDMNDAFIIGVEEATPSENDDVCNHGGSGSTAILADGSNLGTLYTRVNEAVDIQKGDENFTRQDLYNRFYYERETGLDLSRFDSLCVYSSTNQNLASQLVSGFEHPFDYNDYIAAAQARPRK